MVLLSLLADMETEWREVKGLTTTHQVLKKEWRKKSKFSCIEIMAPSKAANGMGENMCKSYPKKGLISEIQEELLQLTSEKPN